MKRKIYCTSDSVSKEQELQKWIDGHRVPKDGSIIKQDNEFGETYYWEIDYVIDDPSELDEYSSVEYFVMNGVFALELPEEEFGGMAFGDISSLRGDDWEYSSYEEAKADNFGHHDDFDEDDFDEDDFDEDDF